MESQLTAKIVWAKDRLVDDLAAHLRDFTAYGDDFYTTNPNSRACNYAARPEGQRQEFRQNVARLATLLNLQEDDENSLQQLQAAGYWTDEDHKDVRWNQF
jgi:hypothetical protein